MSVAGDGSTRRVLVPQALGADEFLRVTWHPSRTLIVFSHWQGDRCIAATPVRVDDIAELAELTAAALASRFPAAPLADGDHGTDGTGLTDVSGLVDVAAWPAPDPAGVVLLDRSA